MKSSKFCDENRPPPTLHPLQSIYRVPGVQTVERGRKIHEGKNWGENIILTAPLYYLNASNRLLSTQPPRFHYLLFIIHYYQHHELMYLALYITDVRTQDQPKWAPLLIHGSWWSSYVLMSYKSSATLLFTYFITENAINLHKKEYNESK